MNKDFQKIVHVGVVRHNGRVFCKISYLEGKLSISGNIGIHSRGQIIMSFKEYDNRGYLQLSDIFPAPGWDEKLIKQFFDLWDRWHLNDMRAGCEHQRNLRWDKEPIDPDKPTTAYGKFHPGQTMDSWNMKGWVYPPYGHLTEPCPICGYKYGTSWLQEEVPTYVITFLLTLPGTGIKRRNNRN